MTEFFFIKLIYISNSGISLNSPGRMASGGVARASYTGHLFKGRANRADMVSIKQAFTMCLRKRKMAMTENLHEPEFPVASHPLREAVV